MKLKSLAIITLFALGCSAFAQQGSATLCFADYQGTPYCNYEKLQWNGWALSGEVNDCGTTNGWIAGAKVAGLAGSGVPVSGLVYAYTDPIFAEQYLGETWFVLTQTVPSTRLHHYGWVGYLGFYGYEFLDNYGYLSACTKGSAPVTDQRTYTAGHEALRKLRMDQK